MAERRDSRWAAQMAVRTVDLSVELSAHPTAAQKAVLMVEPTVAPTAEKLAASMADQRVA